MCRVKADIFWEKPKNIAPEIINGIQEVFAVVTARAGKLHQKRGFNFEGIVPAVEHVKRMPKIPCLVIAVPSPFGIEVRVVAGTADTVQAGTSAGRKVSAERGGVGNYGGTIAGHGKVSGINQAKLYG